MKDSGTFDMKPIGTFGSVSLRTILDACPKNMSLDQLLDSVVLEAGMDVIFCYVKEYHITLNGKPIKGD